MILMWYNKLMDLSTKVFWDLQIVNITGEQWLAWLKHFLSIKSAQLQIVMTPNPEQLVLAGKNDDFHQLLRQADILLPDGQGLVWAASLKQRLTGADSVVEILRVADELGQRVMLIGGRYEQLATDHQLLITTPYGQSEIYYSSGYQNIRLPDQTEERQLKVLLERWKPEIVLVALGAPYQEKWLIEHRKLLSQIGTKLALAVGGSFDFLLGKVKRAPLSWQKLKLEWLWRLLQEPWRIKRQLVLPQFVWWTLTGRWR